jgi:hypothetical protein
VEFHVHANSPTPLDVMVTITVLEDVEINQRALDRSGMGLAEQLAACSFATGSVWSVSRSHRRILKGPRRRRRDPRAHAKRIAERQRKAEWEARRNDES